MSTHLTIESDDAPALATAVTTAPREGLDRERNARDRQARYERVIEIAADIRAHMEHPLPSSDHSDLYDEETGLPK